MSRIVFRLPGQLGFRENPQTAVFSNTGAAYDWAIGGVPFFSGINNDRPLIRRRAPFRKEQFDNSREPGEQSLTGWWIRSQSSFHLGAGVKFIDPAVEESLSNRYETSEGVDVWTPGETRLLNRAENIIPAVGSCIAHGARDGTEDIVLFAEGSTLTRYSTGGTSTVTWGGTGTILSITNDGSNYYVADSTGVYTGTLAGGTGTLKWNTGSPRVVLGWVKQRLMGAIGDALYELAGAGPTLPGPTYTHPNPNWIWTSWTEGPQAIYAAGFVGSRSTIIRLGLDTQGALPALTQATAAAVTPTGETIHSIYAYVGSFIGIGTNKGVRVGVLGQDGVIAYGPLIETPNPVKSMIGHDRFLFCGFTGGFSDDGSGVLRIDLSAPVDQSGVRFAFAPDLQTHLAGEVTSVTLFGATPKIVLAVAGHGAFKEHDTELEPVGFILTSRIRYNTLFPKLFRKLSVRTPPLTGPLGVSVVDDTGGEISIVTLGVGSDPTEDVTVLHPDKQQEHLALRFTFNRSLTDATNGAELRGYQFKALPGGPRPRETIIPLLCFDHELDKFNIPTGFDGWSLDRRLAIEEMDSAGDVILLQDLVQETAELVTIEDAEFRQTSPPGPNEGNWGGILYVTTRGVS